MGRTRKQDYSAGGEGSKLLKLKSNGISKTKTSLIEAKQNSNAGANGKEKMVDRHRKRPARTGGHVAEKTDNDNMEEAAAKLRTFRIMVKRVNIGDLNAFDSNCNYFDRNGNKPETQKRKTLGDLNEIEEIGCENDKQHDPASNTLKVNKVRVVLNRINIEDYISEYNDRYNVGTEDRDGSMAEINNSVELPDTIRKDNSDNTGGPVPLIMDEEGKHLTYSVQSSPQNQRPSLDLTNREDVIENIIMEDEPEAIRNTTNAIATETLRAATSKERLEKPKHRFFHSRIQSPISTNPKGLLKKKKANFRAKLSLSKQSSSEDGVYEFLSQSSSDSRDPVDDVIKKLIDEGKVSVATLQKGTGRLKLKKGRKKGAPGRKAEPKPQNMNNNNNDFDFDFDLEGHVNGDRSEVGCFSNLARSTMIKQGKTALPARRMVTDRQKLLETAKNFVNNHSTPENKKPPPKQRPSIVPWSPIQSHPSPFRVETEDSLPQVFTFQRNSANLPTFSSDCIPRSPSKSVSKSKSASIVNNSTIHNDSNAENIRPPVETEAINVAKQNKNKLSLNPRRGLQNRSPLKPINILSNVALPRFSPKTITNISKPVPTEKASTEVPPVLRKFSSMEDLLHLDNQTSSVSDPVELTDNPPSNPTNLQELFNSTITDTLANTSEKTENPNYRKIFSIDDLFGFEEELKNEENFNQATTKRKSQLKTKLKALKRLLPTPKPTRFTFADKRPEASAAPIENPRTRRMGNLKDIFTSTMIEQNRRDTTEVTHFGVDESVDTHTLFTDPDPDTTFDETKPRNTYSRNKRPRKGRHEFIMFHDSDESGTEEKDSSHEGKKKRTSKRKEKKMEEELNKFAEEFNSMCEEVDQYQLEVE